MSPNKGMFSTVIKGVEDVDEKTDKEIVSKWNFYAVALMGAAYLAITITFGAGGGMPGVGTAAAVTVGSNAATLPYLVLKAYIPTYNTTELTGGATNIGWNAYLTATSYAASEQRVYLVWQAFWTLLVIAGIYLIPAFLFFVYADDAKKLPDADKEKTLKSMSHASFGLSQFLVWLMIGTNYIAFLGEFSKITAWYASTLLALQVSIYYAATFLSYSVDTAQNLKLLEATFKSVSGSDISLTVSKSVQIALFILTTFLWWALLGTGLMVPMSDKGGANGILYIDPPALRATLVFYLFQQTWAYVKFNVINMFGESALAKFFKHELVTLMEHAGVFSLATVYVFEALASLYNAGRLN